MNLRIPFCVSLTLLAATRAAWGQSIQGEGPGVEVAIGYQSLPTKIPTVSRGGLQLSESAIMHIGVGAEAGYDSNVFYGENNVKGSAILRIVPFLELTNAARGGLSASDVFYDLGASLTYREYLSNDAVIRDQRAFMPSAYANLQLSKMQSLGFMIADVFGRTEEPPYINTQPLEPIIRDVNQASAVLRWAPGGGRIGATATYVNTLDLFETQSLKVASSLGHLLALDMSWKWLPKTAIIVQVSQGYIYYLNSDPVSGAKKPASFPFHALTGLRGLITAKLVVNVALGYANGFYDTARPGPSGFRGNFSATADATYHPTLLTSIAVGYRHDFQNAILGDFYYVDAVYLNLGQAIAGRLGLGVTARYESRQFQNIPLAGGTFTSRHDNYWQGGVNLDYHMKEWAYVGVAYSIMSNSSPYEPPTSQDPGRVNYLKQLVFARLGLTY